MNLNSQNNQADKKATVPQTKTNQVKDSSKAKKFSEKTQKKKKKKIHEI